MTNLVGKTWGELSEKQREELMSVASYEKNHQFKKIQPCIIDFTGTIYSIAGTILREEEETIEISESSTIYSSFVN